MTDEPTTAAGRALLRWSEGRGGGYVDLAEVLAIEADARRDGAAEALAAVNDNVGHVVHLWLSGGVDPRGHNTEPDGEPQGDCYKCRRVRDFIREAVEAERKKAAETG